jgi:hypothetical protein
MSGEDTVRAGEVDCPVAAVSRRQTVYILQVAIQEHVREFRSQYQHSQRNVMPELCCHEVIRRLPRRASQRQVAVSLEDDKMMEARGAAERRRP